MRVFPDYRIQEDIFHALPDFFAELAVDELESPFAEFGRAGMSQTKLFEKNEVEIVVDFFLLERVEIFGNERRNEIESHSQHRLGMPRLAWNRFPKKGEDDALSPWDYFGTSHLLISRPI